MLSVSAAVTDVSGVGGFFAVDTGPGQQDGWRPFQELWRDPAVLPERVAVTRDRLAERAERPVPEVEPRVAASILFQGLASRILSPCIGTGLAHGVVVTPATLEWRPAASGPLPLRLAEPGGRRVGAGDLAGAIHRLVLREALAPLAAALRTHVKIAPGLLWGNVASSLAGAVGRLGEARPELAERGLALAGDLLEIEPLRRTGRFVRPWNNRPATFFVRGTCCLYYRLSGGQKCGDCALLDSETRLAQWHASLEP